MRLPVGGEEPSGLIRTSCDDHTGVVVWGKGLDHVMDQTGLHVGGNEEDILDAQCLSDPEASCLSAVAWSVCVR